MLDCMESNIMKTFSSSNLHYFICVECSMMFQLVYRFFRLFAHYCSVNIYSWERKVMGNKFFFCSITIRLLPCSSFTVNQFNMCKAALEPPTFCSVYHYVFHNWIFTILVTAVCNKELFLPKRLYLIARVYNHY